MIFSQRKFLIVEIFQILLFSRSSFVLRLLIFFRKIMHDVAVFLIYREEKRKIDRLKFCETYSNNQLFLLILRGLNYCTWSTTSPSPYE